MTSTRKGKHLDVTTMFVACLHTLTQKLLSANQSARTILVIKVPNLWYILVLGLRKKILSKALLIYL